MLDIGATVGDYLLEEQIGRGGMGVVYRATQLSLGRAVAVKLITPRLADDPDYRERFKREARLSARIAHPNVVPVHQAEECDGHLFIAMHFVRGTDLCAVLDERGRFEPSEAVRIVEQVAAALDAAHELGLVHRDVKPGNVLLSGRTGAEHVYLTDFGLSKDIRATAGVTRTGDFVGTLDYVAPEQVQATRVDGRADVYALGCVLYELLTGAVPFDCDSDMAKLYAHMSEPAPRPSGRVPSLPAELDAVIERSMAKRREDRYSTAGEMAAAARSALTDHAVVPPAAAPAAAAAGHENPLARYAVLVVEDQPYQRRATLMLLRAIGVTTLSEAADGQAALDLLATVSPPDVIICDLQMPGMDGVEFIRQVAERGLASALVIASGLDRRVLEAVRAVSEACGLQVLGAVEKPLTARRLSKLLAAYRPPQPRGSGDPLPAVSGRMLAEALDRHEFTAVFRPFADVANGRISGAEVLARWPPSIPAATDVVPLLEAEQLTERFIDRLLALLCEELHALDRADRPIELWMAIPDAVLTDVSLADRVADRVRASRADPGRIVWILDSRALRPVPPVVLHVLTRLRVLGFGLCVDEFGTGPRPGDHLERLPLTAMRLAQDLVGGAHGDPVRVAMLQDVLDAAHELELRVLGDGCETAVDFELLLQLGCTHAQGAFISEPMAAAQLAEWVTRWSPAAAD